MMEGPGKCIGKSIETSSGPFLTREGNYRFQKMGGGGILE
jgi:hypothetical protein